MSFAHLGQSVSRLSRKILDWIVLAFIFHIPGPRASCDVSSLILTASWSLNGKCFILAVLILLSSKREVKIKSILDLIVSAKR